MDDAKLEGIRKWVSKFKAVSDEMFGVFLSFGSTCLFHWFLLWEGILKKAIELAMSCDADVGLLMFSPTGRLTSYANKGRIEDIFLRYINQPDDFKGYVHNEEFLYHNLKQLKYEAEMLDKIGRFEALERKLCELNRQKYEAQERIRYYNPDMTKILTIPQANLHQQFVIGAIQRIEKLKKAKLLEKETSPSKLNDVEMPAVKLKGSDLTTEESVNSKGKRNQSTDDHKEEACSLAGPHLSISYLLTQKKNIEDAEDITSIDGHLS
ncbi:agamous-like MADS-box protein AGL104 isoform X2 [Durio zibethinus]|uniref:Agamous-like MADS-box protein AGL104 isoform X2 n=1 Tax=Durio zibethinus TaxID=66656 RepID=A0A6P5XFW2_DURZI|nr:agamous-like MADS-box protein AGL104 isoform X2 [Durio zibethinus]